MSAAPLAPTLAPASAPAAVVSADAPGATTPSGGDVASMLFDRDWYLLEYPDVACSGVDPIQHYLTSGAVEGRNPNPCFNTRGYLLNYPDVRASGMNPFMHFMLYGFREGRRAR